jgi:hypothetical protein
MSENHESTLREDLGAAFDEAMGAAEEETVDVEEVPEVEEPAEEPVEEAPEEPVAEEEALEEPEVVEDTDEEPDELEPLKHWHKEDREIFKGLPREAQEFLLRRDKEFQSSATKKQMEVSDIKRAFEPVREDLVKHGISEADAIRRLIGAHVRLQQNPKEGISFLMQSYGINPSDILGVDESGSGDRGDAAMREIQDLKKRLKEYEERTQHERLSTVQQQIEEFAKSNEFFSDVEGEMAAIARSYQVQGQPPPSLEQLYEKACWMNEAVRETLLKRQRDEELKKKAAQSEKNISKSKRASQASVRPARKTSGSTKEQEQKSLRDDLSEAFDKVTQAR